ncbi:MAG: sigma-E processing peptidase SpoIIGA [Oscillospiraceae bacterium]|nr:sigma-E processing peptidase SpoIIGA [Oscillospiraceae bacterium]
MISMNNVYLDLLFLINFFTDYITLLCTAKISHAEIRRKRILIASVFGGIYGCLCMIYKNTWFNTPVIQLTCAIVLCLISFSTERKLLLCYVSFIVISSVFGGFLSPFVFFTKQGKVIPLNLKALIFTFVAVYLLLSYFYRNIKKQSSRQYLKTTITLNKRSVSFYALKDTGNELIDTVSNLPVLIIEETLIHKLIPELQDIEQTDDIYDNFCKMSTITYLIGKLRLIPYQTISENSIMIGFIPDEILIDGNTEKMIVAFSRNKLSQNDTYQGIC